MAAKRERGQVNGQQRSIALALQGAGAHGAFAWGVLDHLLQDGRLAVEGVSATSAGAMNTVGLAHGLMQGGPEGARTALREFWRDIAGAAEMSNPCRKLTWEKFLHNDYALDKSPMYLMTDMRMRTLGRKFRILIEWTWGMFFASDITHLRFTRTHEVDRDTRSTQPNLRP